MISGVGSGLGKAVADAVLDSGDTVFGLLRREAAAREFEAHPSGRAHACLADVTDRDAVFAAVARAEAAGGIDILVNNAGNALEGYVEHVSPEAVRAVMESNLIGPLHAIQAVLPHMRARGRGRILNVSSGGGILGVPWVGLYSASKFALEGMSEALAGEVGPLGIGVTIVEPGAFRTALLTRDHPASTAPDPAYDESAGGIRRKQISAMGGKEPGDPAKFAQALLKIAAMDPAPLRAPLGDDALFMANAKAESLRTDVEALRAIGSGLSFAPADA